MPADNCTVSPPCDEVRFAAYDNGVRWNGYVCPGFSLEAAQAVIAWFNTTELDSNGPNDRAAMIWEGNEIHLHPSANDELDGHEIEIFRPDSDGRYHIGAWKWAWTRASDGAPTQIVEVPQPSGKHASEDELALADQYHLIGYAKNNIATAQHGRLQGLWAVHAIKALLPREEAITVIALIDEITRPQAARRAVLAKEWARKVGMDLPWLHTQLDKIGFWTGEMY